jgi:uncharacterized membrane protein
MSHATTPQARNVRTIAEFEERALSERTVGERLVDAAARVIGTTTFAAGHAVLFALWVVVNTGRMAAIPVFDPLPFSLLNLVVSLEATFLALILVISQNRMARQAERRAHLDLQINLLAEQESSQALVLLTVIAKHLGVTPPVEHPDIHELAGPTDVHQLASDVEGKIPGAQS